MKLKSLSVAVVLPVSLLFAGLAFGQQMTPPATPTTSQQNPSSRMDKMGNTAKFSKLSGSKGYVDQTDAAGVPWLSSHFSQCDTDHNGKLTRTEFNSCKRNYGHGSQYPGSSGQS